MLVQIYFALVGLPKNLSLFESSLWESAQQKLINTCSILEAALLQDIFHT